jgi:hypothetical protein
MSLFSRIEASAASSLLRREAKPRGPPSSYGTTYVTAAGSHGGAAENRDERASSRLVELTTSPPLVHSAFNPSDLISVDHLPRAERGFSLQAARHVYSLTRRSQSPLSSLRHLVQR